MAIWAQAETALAADLLAGDQDPRSTVVALLRRALAALPAAARAANIAVRVDAGYFAGGLARAAAAEHVSFAVGAKRIAPLWRMLAGIDESDWTDAIDMTGAQVAVTDYKPADWPPGTRCVVRQVRLDPAQVSADPRSRRRRTLHPDQRVLPIVELAAADAIYGYSFILTDLDCSTPGELAAVEHWYRHRTTVENVFRDGKHGAALQHLPSGYPEINTAWMWGGLLVVSIAGWLHQLTVGSDKHGRLTGWGTRDGKAMIATLRRRIINVPAQLVHHARQPILRPPPGTTCSPPSWPVSAACQRPPDHPRRSRPDTTGNPPPEAPLGPSPCPQPENRPNKINNPLLRSTHTATRRFGSERA